MARASIEIFLELTQKGDAEKVQAMLDVDPSLAESRDAAGVSLLMHCLYRSRRDLAETIAAKKKALDIFEAASLGRLDRLRQCAANASTLSASTGSASPLSAPSADGFTALHFACFFGQPAAARLLLESGAPVDAVAANPMQVMPLHSAASARNLEAARLLLEHGAPVNARQHGGWAPLHAAAQNGDQPMLDLLLRHGADPSQANDEGKTAAMAAREKGHEAIAKSLEAKAAM